jgi:hypothetical protein
MGVRHEQLLEEPDDAPAVVVAVSVAMPMPVAVVPVLAVVAVVVALVTVVVIVAVVVVRVRMGRVGTVRVLVSGVVGVVMLGVAHRSSLSVR